jgi:predicted nucleotidyltransferase
MVAIVQQRMDSIEQLCRQYGVARLALFGSASAEGSFDHARSDIDFLVEFEGDEHLFARYMDLKDALETLLQRPVDLIMARAIRNPYFLREAMRTQVVVYEGARCRRAV